MIGDKKNIPTSLRITEHFKDYMGSYISVGALILASTISLKIVSGLEQEKMEFIINEDFSEVISKYENKTRSRYDNAILDRENKENGPKTFLPGEHYVIKEISSDDSLDYYDGYKLFDVAASRRSGIILTYVNEKEVEAYATSFQFYDSSEKTANQKKAFIYGDFGMVKEKNIIQEKTLQYKKIK